MIETGFEITVNGKTYKTSSFPSVGKFKDAEIMKSMLSNGQYDNMAFSTAKNAREASYMIAIESYFPLFFPELIKDLKVPIRELSLKDYMEIRKAYSEQFIPQWNEWTKIFNNLGDE